MPLAVTCACGKSFHVKDELAGKKIKCPFCQAIVEVPAAGPAPAVPAPAAVQPAKALLVEDDPPVAAQIPSQAAIVEEDFDERPRRGKKPKRAAKGGSSTMLFVGLGVGGVLLLFCCIGGGIGGYFLFLAGPGDPEKVIVGKWQYDSGFGGWPGGDPGYTMEFKEDGTYIKTFNNAQMAQPRNGKWKASNKDGSYMRVETTFETEMNPGFVMPGRDAFEFHFVSKNSMESRILRQAPTGIKWKRV
jgi:hypothetical protein